MTLFLLFQAMFNELGIEAGGNITKQAFFEKFESQRK